MTERVVDNGIMHPGFIVATTAMAAMVKITELAAEQEQQMEELAQKASRDPLTGAYNLRYLQESFTGLVESQSRRVGDLEVIPAFTHGIMVVDVDNFKRINDSKGHAEGDKILKIIVNRMQQNSRTRDVVARTGGDEFTLLLPRTKPEIVTMTAEAVLEEVAEATEATVTIGISYTDSPTSLDNLRHEADIALYAAKAQGRNRIMTFADVPKDIGLDA